MTVLKVARQVLCKKNTKLTFFRARRKITKVDMLDRVGLIQNDVF